MRSKRWRGMWPPRSPAKQQLRAVGLKNAPALMVITRTFERPLKGERLTILLGLQRQVLRPIVTQRSVSVPLSELPKPHLWGRHHG